MKGFACLTDSFTANVAVCCNELSDLPLHCSPNENLESLLHKWITSGVFDKSGLVSIFCTCRFFIARLQNSYNVYKVIAEIYILNTDQVLSRHLARLKYKIITSSGSKELVDLQYNVFWRHSVGIRFCFSVFSKKNKVLSVSWNTMIGRAISAFWKYILLRWNIMVNR